MVKRSRRVVFVTFLFAFGVLGAVGCSSTPTEIIVLVDTNLGAGEVDIVRLLATSPEGETRMAEVAVTDDLLPVSQSHLQGGGSSGPYRFEAVALLAGIPVVSAAKTASFVDGARKTLRLNLDRSCLSVVCGNAAERCELGACAPISAAVLEDYSGKSRFYTSDAGPQIGDSTVADANVADAVVPDASPDGCVSSPEVCDGIDNDCDNRMDEGFDLTSDMNNCGRCGVACQVRPGVGIESASCVDSDCIFTCEANFDDCDGDFSNGCEDLSRKQRCGDCDTNCRNRSCRIIDETYTCR